MEEKVLITSTHRSPWKIVLIFTFIGVLLLAISCSAVALSWAEHHVQDYNAHIDCEADGHHCIRKQFSSASECRTHYFWVYMEPRYLFDNWRFPDWEWGLIAFGVFLTLAIVSYFGLKNHRITVTNKRVYGNTAFGKRVDIPNDSISAVATISFLKGITVASSSGKISFMLIKNSAEIHEVINTLLIERQNQSEISEPKDHVATNGRIEELKQYKELLDSGVITQEDFDTKKKQLLGL